VTLGYQSYGTGDHKVIVLHGWFGDHSMFGPMRSALDTNAFTYIFPAYRGYGLSKHLTGNYTNAEISADIIALADEIGLPQFSLIGHSMGGKAIQRVLADAPKRVKKLVAVTAVPAAAVPFDAAGWGLFEGAATRIENRKGILHYSTGSRLSDTWIAHMANYSLHTSTVEAFAGYLRAWAKEEFVADVQGHDHPIKVIVGEHDPSLTADIMKATYMAWYKNAELEVMPNAGHYPMDETPVALATSIENFLKK
jgi:pimeloyl-ACP methyl ester carboxylesterase